MKCPICWTNKAYVREIRGWKGLVMACLLLRPMKCHHCHHKYVTSWLLTLGKQTVPPKLRIAPISRNAGPSYAAQHLAAQHEEQCPDIIPMPAPRSKKAEAA
jgi:hypothetical protein